MVPIQLASAAAAAVEDAGDAGREWRFFSSCRIESK